jgi:hypothetical protein
MASISAIPLLGAILASAMGGVALGQVAKAEQPWVDITKHPLDVRELNAANIASSAAQPANHLFVLVRGGQGQNLNGIATSYDSSVVITTTSSADVQIGNSKTVKTFHIQAGLSQCYAQTSDIGCISNGRTENVNTTSLPSDR